MRTFTLPEAQTMLPILDSLLQRAQASAAVASAREHSMQSLSHAIFLSGGLRVDLADVARIKAEHGSAVTEARDTLEEINAIGVEVRDLDTDYLNFLSSWMKTSSCCAGYRARKTSRNGIPQTADGTNASRSTSASPGANAPSSSLGGNPPL